MWDVIRHPVEVIRDAMASGSSTAEPDLGAVAAGEVRQVSCWLRGTAPGMPERLTQGTLFIGADGMTWVRWWRHRRRESIPIPPLDHVQQVVRPASRADGRLLKRGMFTNVVANGPAGTVEFVVPGVGPALIRQAIEHPGGPG